jgi:hypothetical protein
MLHNGIFPSRDGNGTRCTPPLAAAPQLAPGHPGQMLRQARELVMQQAATARVSFLTSFIEQIKTVNPDWTANRTVTRGGGAIWRGAYRNVLYVSPAGEIFQAPVVDSDLLQAAQDDNIQAVRTLVPALQGRVWMSLKVSETPAAPVTSY